MRRTDIAIIGGGLAGSLAAAMLGRRGIDAVLIDPHAVYPEDLRCEKLDGSQVAILRRTGLADTVLRVATFDGACWIARFGRLIERRPGDQHGILYDTLVNTVRSAIPDPASVICAKATAVTASDDRQCVTLSNGETVSARLVVLANGLNIGLRQSLGIAREVVSACHSVTIAFNLKPVGRRNFEAPALSYYGERPSDRAAYITLFPIGAAMRANLMVYRDLNDPWLRDMRHQPLQTLDALLPRLRKVLGDYDIDGAVKIRPADLYVSHGYRRSGVVLAGDAFGTSCPAAGTGTSKVFTDVERLCNVYIPQWLSTEGMSADKIAAFYDDPVKRACDAHSFHKAYNLRSITIEPGLRWTMQRWVRFVGRGVFGFVHSIRSARATRAGKGMTAASPNAPATTAGS